MRVDHQRLFDDRERAHARVERRVRDPGRPSACRGGPRASARSKTRARSRRGTCTSPDGRLDQPQHAAAGRALAAAGFADERERLALLHRKAHIVDGADDGLLAEQPAAALEVLDEVADFDERHQPHRRPGGPSVIDADVRASGTPCRRRMRRAARRNEQPAAGARFGTVPSIAFSREPACRRDRASSRACRDASGCERCRAPGPARRSGPRTSPRRDPRFRRSRRGRG